MIEMSRKDLVTMARIMFDEGMEVKFKHLLSKTKPPYIDWARELGLVQKKDSTRPKTKKV
jgi:hypothetical protein